MREGAGAVTTHQSGYFVIPSFYILTSWNESGFTIFTPFNYMAEKVPLWLLFHYQKKATSFGSGLLQNK
jgi:hypothetical protein